MRVPGELTAPPCERCWAAWIATTTRTAKRTVECDWRKRGWGLGEPTHICSMRWNGDSALFAAVRYYPPTDYTRQQRSAYGDTPTARLPPLPSTALALRERCRPDQPAAGQVFRPLSRWPAALQLAASPAASSVHGSILTPGRREPDAARWTQRPGPHPCRDMCVTALRGACAPDTRRATEFTHWPRLAASK